MAGDNEVMEKSNPSDLAAQHSSDLPARQEPGLKTMIAYSVANFPAGFLLLAVAVWLMRLYCPSEDETGRILLVSPKVFGAISLIVMILAGFTDLFVGYFSDKTVGSSGRRQPYMRWGLPFLAMSFLLLWFPPVQAQSPWNVVWLFVMLGTIHVSFTVVVNPYLALMPEVWQNDANRVRVSVWMSVVNVFSQVFAFVGFGLAIDTFMNGGQIFGLAVPDGFKLVAVVGGILTVVSLFPVFRIKEPPLSADKKVDFTLRQAVAHTLNNPAFLPYIVAGSMLYASQFIIEAALPYLVVTQVVADPEKGDLIASFVLLGLVVATAFLFPVADKLSQKYEKRVLFMVSLVMFTILLPLTTGLVIMTPDTLVDLSFVGLTDVPMRMIVLIAVCLLIAPALAIGLVIPRAILADVMDHDIERTGFRREAMYNGMEGLIQKVAGGLALALQGGLFAWLGYTREEPWGIVGAGIAGGLLSLIGVFAFIKYPIRK